MDARSSGPPGTWRRAVAGAAENLSPGAFAFVMATGIVSTALAKHGASASSAVLLWIAGGGYVVLWAGYVWRMVFRWRRFRADLAGAYGFAFLTLVAASEVLAGRVALDGHYGAATVLTVIGVAGWLVLGYGVPLLLVCSGHALPLRQVNGTWFIWVVGTQSVAVATAALAPHTGGRVLGILASVCWAVGLLQYLLVAALALARLVLEPAEPKELTPPYWVFMGAAAISVLAGASLLRLPSADALLPGAFVLGISAVAWSFCTWLIPLLLALGVWRHVLHRVPLRYETSLWSVVFPVGMYGVASRELGEAAGWGWMTAAGAGEAWVALAVWAAVFAGMLAAPVTALVRSQRAGIT
ncbi:tellurite resistance/C4-dicarboxylate transporter family protein [Streptomyces sp. NPDC127039]|uniref:tellurite resistance/C4-dicarboxylate transporter family protein n=1 Tax=Streptomyces sp. NPDC127039 TaxID=3347115 RepID=UPI003646CB69